MLRLRRLIHREPYGQTDNRGWVLVKALYAVKTRMLTAGFESRHDQ